jgi:hypothetical protein
MPGEIISEHRATSNRNGGRHHRGFAGDFPRNPHARLLSLGLVATLGFLMLVSLVVSAGLTALGSYLSELFPGGRLVMLILNSTISLMLISALLKSERHRLRPADGSRYIARITPVHQQHGFRA